MSLWNRTNKSKIGVSPNNSLFENFVIIRQELEKQLKSNINKINYIEKLHNHITKLENDKEELRITRTMLNDYICENRRLKNKVKDLECDNKCLNKMVATLANTKKDLPNYNEYV